MAVTPAYYKDGVPYDASGQVIITITGDKPPTPLVTDLGDGKFQFKSKHKFCYLKTINPLGVEWVMNRGDGNGVAACFATDSEKQVAISLLSGFMPAPAYTQEQFQAAMLLLGAPGAMALGAGQWGMQLSVAGEGVMTLAGETAGLLEAVVSRAAALLTTSIAEPAVAAASTLLFSPPAGGGSDRVPGRDLEALFALNAKLLTGKTAKISPGSSSLDLPVRGSLVYSNGQLALELLKTGGEVPAAVPVLSAVRDAMTGLDIITVPAMAGAPPRTILVNPVPAPATPVNTGNTGTVPVTPVHTGTDMVPVGNLVVTPPSGDPGGLRDFIYWRPDAKGTGVEPVYVMLSNPRNLPGKVDGKGQPVGEGWLNNADKDPGSPIPSQIADKLCGREFANFDAFRKAFWTEVGKDPKLSKQFKSGNFGNIKAGKAPAPKEAEQVGGRVKYELHHVNPVKDNSGVYVVDNIRITTPKHHIEIHRRSK